MKTISVMKNFDEVIDTIERKGKRLVADDVPNVVEIPDKKGLEPRCYVAYKGLRYVAFDLGKGLQIEVTDPVQDKLFDENRDRADEVLAMKSDAPAAPEKPARKTPLTGEEFEAIVSEFEGFEARKLNGRWQLLQPSTDKYWAVTLSKTDEPSLRAKLAELSGLDPDYDGPDTGE